MDDGRHTAILCSANVLTSCTKDDDSVVANDEAGVNYTMGKDECLVRTDSLIIKNLKTNKVLQISQEIGKVPYSRLATAAATALCTTTA